MEPIYQTYMLDQLKKLLAIRSTTGLYEPIQDYLVQEVQALGFTANVFTKGGLTVDCGGTGNGLVVMAHADEIGYMVRFVNPDGSIRITNVGGLHAFMSDQVNVRVITRGGGMYTGTLRRKNSSLHLMTAEERNATANYETNLFLYLDEDVRTDKDVAALGIRCGDIVTPEPNTTFTSSGYIKSRFLDDKVSVAILFTLMKEIKERHMTLPRHLTMHFSLYEEIGHGGCFGIPTDTDEVLAVDIGCCGPSNYTDEKKVSICVLDTAFPYHRGMVDALISAAERAGADYTLDVFLPGYGSDANAVLRSGKDVRHGLIGPGVLSAHGYERTHEKSLIETYKLLKGYVMGA